MSTRPSHSRLSPRHSRFPPRHSRESGNPEGLGTARAPPLPPGFRDSTAASVNAGAPGFHPAIPDFHPVIPAKAGIQRVGDGASARPILFHRIFAPLRPCALASNSFCRRALDARPKIRPQRHQAAVYVGDGAAAAVRHGAVELRSENVEHPLHAGLSAVRQSPE